MGGSIFVITATTLCLLVGCGRPADRHWEDGDFVVYAIDTDFRATKLGFNHRPGLLGLVAPEVTAAGSNADVVVVERIDPSSRERVYYIVRKEGDSGEQPGPTNGPFSRSAFEEIRATQNLPDFSWRKP